jgi:hypothetical protein
MLTDIPKLPVPFEVPRPLTCFALIVLCATLFPTACAEVTKSQRHSGLSSGHFVDGAFSADGFSPHGMRSNRLNCVVT